MKVPLTIKVLLTIFIATVIVGALFISGCSGKPEQADPGKMGSATEGKPIEVTVRRIDSSGNYVYSQKVLEPAKTAIIIVDMWHLGGAGYINPDGSFTGTNEGYFYQQDVADSINETIGAARALGITIVHMPAGQAYIYNGLPAREHIRQLPRAAYPWKQKPDWNDERWKIPFSNYPFEYDYAYPYTKKEGSRPGTLPFGQTPRIVIADNDYLSDDVEELWNLLQAKRIKTLVYMGGSTNMCLAGRPYGLLNMRKYGMDVLLDRNYAHLIHRIPHGWNGDTLHPRYGPFFTNERNSRKVIDYFEQNLCPTLDGCEFGQIAQSRGGYKVLKPAIGEAVPDADNLNLSFQTQMIEVAPHYNTDIGWIYGPNPNGLVYGWNRLKVKDAIREGYDPVKCSYIKAVPGDSWKIKLPASRHACLFLLSGKGQLIINGVPHTVDSKEPTPLNLVLGGDIKTAIRSGEIRFYELKIERREESR